MSPRFCCVITGVQSFFGLITNRVAQFNVYRVFVDD